MISDDGVRGNLSRAGAFLCESKCHVFSTGSRARTYVHVGWNCVLVGSRYLYRHASIYGIEWLRPQIVSRITNHQLHLKRDLRYCYGEFQSENNSSLSRFQNGWIEMSFDSKPSGISRFRTIAKGCPTTSNLTSIGPKRRVNHIYTLHTATASEEDHQSQRSAQKVASGRLHNISIHTSARPMGSCVHKYRRVLRSKCIRKSENAAHVHTYKHP